MLTLAPGKSQLYELYEVYKTELKNCYFDILECTNYSRYLEIM